MEKHKIGEEIQVSNDGVNWFTRIFLAEVNGKYICVDVEWVEAYRRGDEPYMCMAWTHCIRYDIPITITEAVEYMLEDLDNNNVKSSDGYYYVGYAGIGIMHSKWIQGQKDTKFFKVKK